MAVAARGEAILELTELQRRVLNCLQARLCRDVCRHLQVHRELLHVVCRVHLAQLEYVNASVINDSIRDRVGRLQVHLAHPEESIGRAEVHTVPASVRIERGACQHLPRGEHDTVVVADVPGAISLVGLLNGCSLLDVLELVVAGVVEVAGLSALGCAGALGVAAPAAVVDLLVQRCNSYSGAQRYRGVRRLDVSKLQARLVLLLAVVAWL
mmetsp:Transcript_15446/g.60387  ORF Transcript_15446/g.60387 Transcript_15446/m.60387 type:complete len:211 (-) Transcript_15446:242-874(-)